MEKQPISELLETTMQKIREMIGANSIVGEPITTPDKMMLIPVSKVAFGFAGGGTDFSKKEQKSGYGGGTGAGVNITPVAFLVIKDGKIEIIYVNPPPTSTVDRIIDAVPDMIDKVSEFISKDSSSEA
ncbi:MAG: GerW family sporulation protein [Oscillospiraceae bacterium]|nr:GerW family sporulation protein [Oscillospiraceae bacterium]